MAASARRSFDTDNITLRTIFARGAQNRPIQSTMALTADGNGGTRWIHPSSLGAYSLNYISTDTTRIQWDLSQNNVFYLNGGQGAGIQSTANRYQAVVYAKAYQAFKDRNSGTGMTVLDSTGSLLCSTLNTSTTSWQVYTTFDSTTQTMYLNTNPIKFLATNVENSNQVATYSNAQSVQMDNIYSTIQFMGVGDIKLTTITTPKRGIFIGLSTMTSAGFLDISGQVAALRAFSTNVPYNYRSTLSLGPTNSLAGYTGPLSLSTPYIAKFTNVFTVLQNPDNAVTRGNESITILSTIGYPYTTCGERGGIIPSITSNGYPVSSGTYTDLLGVNYNIALWENINIPASLYGGDAYISSLLVRFDSFSSIINRNADASIQINYTPNFLFPPTSTITGASCLTPFSTFVTCRDIPIPGISVENRVYPCQQPPFSNFIALNLNITVPKSVITENYMSSYNICHYLPSSIGGFSNTTNLPGGDYTLTRSGFISKYIQSLDPTNNTANISIIGQ